MTDNPVPPGRGRVPQPLPDDRRANTDLVGAGSKPARCAAPFHRTGGSAPQVVYRPISRFCHSEAAAGCRGNPFPFSASRNAPKGDADCRVAAAPRNDSDGVRQAAPSGGRTVGRRTGRPLPGEMGAAGVQGFPGATHSPPFPHRMYGTEGVFF